MKICVINPNTTSAMTERIGYAAEEVARPDTQIIALTAPCGPASIESHFDEAVSVVGLCDAIRASTPQNIDAYVIACFGDPGLNAARELTRAPVVGIAQAAFQMASHVATRFSVITTLRRTCIMTEHLLHQYGYAHLCCKVRAAEIPVLALEQDPDCAYQRILAEAQLAKEQDQIGAIVLGCAGMADLVKRLRAEICLPAIDGVGAAVTLAESLVTLGLQTYKSGDLAAPPPKLFNGRFSDYSSQS